RSASIAQQVAQSFQSSLEHLGLEHIDSYVLHGPSQRHRLARGDWEAWRAMEKIAGAGGARLLGISNVDLAQVEELYRDATVKPRFVQNRCYARFAWDREVRAFCKDHGIVYQGFSLLTANLEVQRDRRVRALAESLHKTPQQVIFRFALEQG